MESFVKGGVDVILLDLSLPDSQGLDTFIRMHTKAPEVPIVVLTGLDDETISVQAMQAGAQDYLIKGQVDSNLLVRSIRYSIERQQLLAELQAMSLFDGLTGLYNQRGFLNLAEQHLKLAQRTNKGFLIAFLDLDGLKQINDKFGHQEGNQALVETANILKETFRHSDIIARIAGDEFVVLAIDVSDDSAEIITDRLLKKLNAHNAKNDLYGLSISLGIACYDPKNPCSIDEMLSQADALMYEQKRKNELRR